MAAARGCLPLLATLAVLVSCNVKAQGFQCQRIRGVPTPPCRYYCSYFDGYGHRWVMAAEEDGTPCGWDRRGICRSGRCYPLRNEHHGQFEQSSLSSKMPLRIRKRDTSSVNKAGDDTAEFTKTVSATKTVSGSDSTGEMHKGFKGVKTVTVGGKKTGRKTQGFGAEVDPFSTLNAGAGTSQTDSFYTATSERQQGSQGLQGNALNTNVGTSGGGGVSSLDITTKSIKSIQGPGSSTSQTGLTGGLTGTVRTSITGTSVQTQGGTGVPNTIQGGGATSTIFGGGMGAGGSFPPGAGSPSQGGTIGGGITPSLLPGLTTMTTNLASTTTEGYGPTPSVGVTGQGAPLAGVTGGGVEVELPGYTTGVGKNWKWVLGRKVGFLPPNVQALDPEVLYYKLGYQQPMLPRLPEPIQTLLNRLPVRPVGSDLIGYPGSTSFLENIQNLGSGIGSLPGLRNLLLRSRLSPPSTRVSLIRALLSSDSSSPLGLSPLDRLLLSSVSPLGDRPSGLWPGMLSPQRGSPYGGYFGGVFGSSFGSPYGSPFRGPYGGPYGSPWTGFPGSPFSGSPWPFYPGGPMGPFGPSVPGSPFYPGFPFSGYPFTRSPFYPGYPGVGGTSPIPGLTSTSTVSSTSGVHYTLSPDGKLVPTTEPTSPIGVTLPGGQPSYSKSTTVHSVTSTTPTGVRYVQSPDGTLVPVSDTTDSLSVHGPVYPGTDQAGQVIPGLIRSISTKTRSLQGYPRGYTLTPDGQLVPTSDSLLQGIEPIDSLLQDVGPLSALSSDPNSPLYRLLRGPYGADPRVRKYLRSILRSGSKSSPYTLLRLLGVRPGSSAYDSILRKTLLGGEPGGIFGLPGDGTSPLGPGLDGITGLTSLLSDGSVDKNGETVRYLAALAGIDPALLGPLSTSGGPLSSTTRTIELLRRLRQPYGSDENDPLTQLLYGKGQPLTRGGSRFPFDISGPSDTIDRILRLYGMRPGSQGTTSMRKEITKALLTSTQPQPAPTGSKETVISKLVATGTSPGQPAPQPGSHVVSSTYHATNVQSASPVTPSPAISGVHITAQKLQPQISPSVLGVKSVSSVTSGTSTIPAYGTPGISPLYTTPTSGVVVNGRFVSTTGGVLGSTLGQPGGVPGVLGVLGSTLGQPGGAPGVLGMLGSTLGHPGLTSPLVTGGYSAYTGIPSTSGLLSTTTTTHPYVLATSPLGGHPHYVVEGHEAPGTRWQLSVWRHHPGVSALIPGLTGVGTSPLSGILSQATQGLTHALPLGSQPSHFGFTSYQASTPGMGLLGTSPLSGIPTVGASGSHYIVHAPDGSIIVSRQPGTLGSSALVSPFSVTQTPGALIPGLTNIAGGAISVPATPGAVLTTPVQTTLVGGAPVGGVTTARYQQYSSVQGGSPGLSSGLEGSTQSLLDSLGSGGSSDNIGSSFSSSSSSSGNVLADALLSQSKLRK